VALVSLVMAAAGGAYALRPSATLVVENALLEPVVLNVGGGAPSQTVRPGDVVRVSLPRGPLRAQWTLVRPAGSNGQPLGELLSGTIESDAPRGEVRQRIDLESTGRLYFAPLVSNRSAVPVSLSITADTGSVFDCACTVPAGGQMAHLGYYRLTARSGVKASDARGRAAEIGPLVEMVEEGNGLAAVTVEARHFPSVASRRSVVPHADAEQSGSFAARPNPLLGTSPPEAQPSKDSVRRPAPPQRGAPPEKATEHKDNPLGGIFPN
jgi:hypothetical protein